MKLSKDFRLEFQRKLKDWFEHSKRSMPWRETRDPYNIWISEIMLQQTQVDTATKYFKKFIRRFPDVHSLAKATLGEVLKVWEGLGYYSRARNLHKAAQIMERNFRGDIPNHYEDLLSLPGIGEYTAGAILSIAFDKKSPVLDGNVIRVLARIFRITENVDSSQTKRRLWDLAKELLPEKRFRDHNEAIMELGALVCTPRKPQCLYCPIVHLCDSKKHNVQNELPIKAVRKPIPHYDVTAGVIWKNEKLLITLRPPRGLLGGLWEFPGGKRENGETLEQCLKREILEELGIDINIKDHFLSVKHGYTHFRITLHVFNCIFQKSKIRLRGSDDYRWIVPEELDHFAFPGADRKVIEALKEQSLGGEW